MTTLATNPAWMRTLTRVLGAIVLTALTAACGEAEPPIRQPLEECKPEQTRPQRCGINGSGTQQQVCEEGRWRDAGACDDPDVCVFGRTSERACGPGASGVMALYCLDGQWVDDSDCEGGDVCETGETDPRTCGFNDNGSLTATCVDGQWDDSAACDDPDVCRNTTTRPEPCGGLNDNASRIMLCQAGQWVDHGQCVDPDVCVNGDNDNAACGGLNGNATQARTCVSGQWENSGACTDPDECRNGTFGDEACGGLNGNASLPLLCSNGEWQPNGPCTDPDVCENGETNTQNCGGLNGNATQEEICSGGQWTLSGACEDPDECTNGNTRESSCGFDGGGLENFLCDDGAWTSTSVCSVLVGAVYVGTEHACAIISGGGIGCWGFNSDGQLGVPAPTSESRIRPLDFDLSAGTFISDIAVGGAHTCALTNAGDIYCWGNEDTLQTGERPAGTPTHEAVAIPLPTSLHTATDPNDTDEFFRNLYAGDAHTCGITTHNRIFCWGDNTHGQLGVPASLPLDEITETDFSAQGDEAIALAVGHAHSCAIMEANGGVKCWGRNDNGQLGDGLTADTEDADVIGLGGAGEHFATQVAAGTDHTCILNNDEEVYCWGDNTYGQLGNSDLNVTNPPEPILANLSPDAEDPYSELNASRAATCVSRMSGALFCWGVNTGGLLGLDAPDSTIADTPTLMANVPSVLQFAFRGDTACVVSDDGRAYCWGDNSSYLLSRGAAPSTHIPQMLEYP